MDAGALANVLRRPAVAAENTSFERITLSVKLAITVASAHGGRAELARELQALAGRYPAIRLVQSPGAAARLEAGPSRFPISAGLRDALLAAARAPDATPVSTASKAAANAAAVASAAGSATSSAASSAASGLATRPLPATMNANTNAVQYSAPTTTSAVATESSPTAVAALASASLRAAAHWPAMLLSPRSAAPARAQSAAADAPARGLKLPLSTPLVEDAETDTTQVAARLAGALRASGLFTEAQMARSIGRPQEAGAAETAAPREAVRLTNELTLGERAAAQLDVLRRDAAAFVLDAWTAQKARLDIGRERVDGDAGGGEAAPVFFATLQLELPQRGPVTVRLRLLNATIAATVEAADPGPWQSALPELLAQLAARGLQAASVAAMATRQSDDDAAGA